MASGINFRFRYSVNNPNIPPFLICFVVDACEVKIVSVVLLGNFVVSYTGLLFFFFVNEGMCLIAPVLVDYTASGLSDILVFTSSALNTLFNKTIRIWYI